MDVPSPFIPVLCHLIDSSTESPVHVLMLSIQAVRGLPQPYVAAGHTSTFISRIFVEIGML